MKKTVLAAAAASVCLAQRAQADLFEIPATDGIELLSAVFTSPPGGPDGPGTGVEGPADRNGDSFNGEYTPGYWDGQYRKPLFNFLLPDLPAGEQIVSANFDVNLFYQNGSTPPSYNVDLVGLGTQAIDAAPRFFAAQFDQAGTLLQDDLLTPASPNGINETDATGDAALVDYLNNVYVAGDFVQLRLDYDALPVQFLSYVIWANGNGNAPVLTFETAPVTPSLPGDANGDGTVDLADFGILRANFGSTMGTFATGDFNGDMNVDLADFGILRANFGTSTPSDIAALDGWYASVVPEPTTAAALALGSLCVLGRRSRR
ncbi:MAG: PEP-CTERM sorting domain-containing protein [Planctomycetota bacterium]